MGVALSKLVSKEEREERQWIPVRMRREVMERDKGQCQFCPNDADGVVHRVPKCRGGKTVPFNLAASCQSCQRNKNQQLVEEFVSSPYYRFEILKVENPLEGKIMKIVVHFDDGEIVKGEVGEDPANTSGDFYIKTGENGGKVLIPRVKVKYIEVLPTLSENLKQ